MTNIWRRSLSMLLALVMVIGMLPLNALASEIEIQEMEEVTAEAVAAVETEETTPPAPTQTEAQETVPPTTEALQTQPPETETEPPETEPPETESPETEPAVTEPEETQSQETEPAPTQPAFTVTSDTFVPDEELPSDEELFRGYAESQFYGTGISAFGTAAGAQLTGDEKLAYDALVPYMKQIASGQRSSTTIKLGASFGDQTVDGVTDNYDADTAVNFSGDGFPKESLDRVMRALLADMPYEMYWFDKVNGVRDKVLSGSSSVHVQFYFRVSPNYQGANNLTVDTGLTGAAAAAAETAKAVVETVAADKNIQTDYDKLLAYKEWVCAAVDYNRSAASSNNFTENSDPWQLIYVFDGDADTRVVCEGYSKAFQYLCDLTEFDGDVTCYSVTGTMSGGPHMWNIVTIDGENYLADVTNSDAGASGADGQLFMVGAEANANGSYTMAGLVYVYDDSTKSLWDGTPVLTMATSNYEPANSVSGNMTQADFAAALASAEGTYFLDGMVDITSDMTIDKAVYVSNGYGLNIAEGVTLTLESNLGFGTGVMNVNGTLVNNGFLYADMYGAGTSIVVSGTLENNSSMMIGNGTLALNGTYTAGTNAYVTMSEHAQIANISKIGKENIQLNIIASDEATFLNALSLRDGFASQEVLVDSDIYLTTDAEIPSGVNVALGYRSSDTPYGLTILEGAALTVNGYVYSMMDTCYVRLHSGALLESNGSMGAMLSNLYNYGDVNVHGFMSVSQTLENKGHINISGALSLGDAATVEWNSYVGSTLLVKDNGSLFIPDTANVDQLLNENILVDMTDGSNPTIDIPEGIDVTGFFSVYAEETIPAAIAALEAAANAGTIEWGDVYMWGEMAITEGFEMSRDVTMIVHGQVTVTNAAISLPLSQVWISEGASLTLGQGASLSMCNLFSQGRLILQSGSSANLGTNDNWVWSSENYGYIEIDSNATFTLNNDNYVKQLYNYGIISGNITVKNGEIITQDEGGRGTYTGTQEELLSWIQENIDNGNTACSYDDWTLVLTEDLTLNLPEGFSQYFNLCDITVPSGVTMTLNGENMALNNTRIHVEEGGTLINNVGFFGINDNSELVVDGTLTNNGHMHVGLYKQDNAQYNAGTLTVNGTLNNYGYLNVWPEGTNGGGVVNIPGTLNVRYDVENELFGFVELHGTMTIGGHLSIQVYQSGGFYVGPSGYLNVTGTYDDGVTRSSEGTVIGIDPSKLGIQYDVYTMEALEAALTDMAGYAGGSIDVYDSFVIERDITIPENGQINLWGDENNQVVLTVNSGVTVTNNNYLGLNANTRMVFEAGSALENNGHIYIDQYASLSMQGTYSGDGSVDGSISYSTMSQDELEGHLENAAANGYGWVHESETRLDRDMTIDLSEKTFYLDAGGRLIVPNGVTLYLNSPVNLTGGEIVVEPYGRVVNSSTLTIESGQVRLFDHGVFLNNGTLSGTITYEGGDPYLSFYWIDGNEDGEFARVDEGAENGYTGVEMAPGQRFRWLIYRNIYNEDTGLWERSPVAPGELSTTGYLTVTPATDNTDWTAHPDEEYGSYFVDVAVADDASAWDTMADIKDNVSGATMGMHIRRHSDGGFYAHPVASNANWIYQYTINPLLSDNSFYFILTQGNTIHSAQLDYEEQEGKASIARVNDTVYKCTIDPEYAANALNNGGFDFRLKVTVMDSDGNTFDIWKSLWCQPYYEVFGDHDAYFELNNTGYHYLDGYDKYIIDSEAGRTVGDLPEGVYYDYDNNILTLDNVCLTQLWLGYHTREHDEYGNVVEGGWEDYCLPNANLTLNLIGSGNRIDATTRTALEVTGELNLTIGGSGELWVSANNGTGNSNERGTYTIDAIQVNGGSSLTVGGQASVTAEIMGIAHWENGEQAWLNAVNGCGDGILTVGSNAELITMVPEDARRGGDTLVDNGELGHYPGGYGGIDGFAEINIAGTVDTQEMSGEFVYNQTGGTVRINPIGGKHRTEKYEWNDQTQQDEYLGIVDHYHYEGIWAKHGVNISGGHLYINVDIPENEKASSAWWQGIASEGPVNISGDAFLSIYGNWGGRAIGLDQGGSLTISGGHVDAGSTSRDELVIILETENGSQVNLTGGLITSKNGRFFLKDANLDGIEIQGSNVAFVPMGNSTMNSGKVSIGDNSGFHVDGNLTMNGGEIEITNGDLRIYNEMDLNGGTITIWNHDSAVEHHAMYVGGILRLRGGDIEINHEVENDSYAVHTDGEILITSPDSQLNVRSLAAKGINLAGHHDDEGNLLQGAYFYITDGVVNLTGSEAANPGIDLNPCARAYFEGGQITAQNAHFKLGGTVEWIGTELDMNYAGLYADNQFNMTGGRIHVENLGALALNGGCNISGGTIDLDNSVMRAGGGVHISGETLVDIDIDEGILVDEYDYALMVENYLAIENQVQINIDINGLDTSDRFFRGILNLGTYHQMGGTVTVNSDVNVAPNVLSIGSMLLNAGTLTVNGGRLGLVQAYDFDAAATGEEKFMQLQLGFTLNAAGQYGGLCVDGIVENNGGTINASSLGSEEGSFGMLVEKYTINEDYSGENVSRLIMNGGEINLNSPSGCGLFLWHAPAEIYGGEININAVTAVKSITETEDGTNFVGDLIFLDLETGLPAEALVEVHPEGGYAHIFETGSMQIANADESGFMTQQQLAAAIQERIDSGYGSYELSQPVVITSDCDLNLPEGFGLYINGTTVTVNSGASLNPGQGFVELVNGAVLDVKGTVINDSALWINQDSEIRVSGTLLNNKHFHVGFNGHGTLNITGTVNNRGYLNICPENMDTLGTVNVEAGGILNNLCEDGYNGFIEHHGILNIHGTLNNGTADNPFGCTTVIYGGVHLWGQINNYSSISLEDDGDVNSQTAALITYQGAVVDNRASLSNRSTGELDLSAATYIHHDNDGWADSVELAQMYFGDDSLAPVYGVDPAQMFLVYNGSDVSAAQRMIDYADANGYGEYGIQVNGRMEIPAETHLIIGENGYMPMMPNSTLVIYGDLTNEGFMQVGEGSSLIIEEDGRLMNVNALLSYGALEPEEVNSCITNYGTIENHYTGMITVNGDYEHYGTVINDMVGLETGTITGIPIEQQTLFTAVNSVEQAQYLWNAIDQMNQNYGYGLIWLRTDMVIPMNLEVPENVTIEIRNHVSGDSTPVTVTIPALDPDSYSNGGNVYNYGSIRVMEESRLVVNGILGNMGGSLTISDNAVLENNGIVSNRAELTIDENATLINNGRLHSHPGEGVSAVVNGTYEHGADAKIYIVYAPSLGPVSPVQGVDMAYQILYHEISSDIPEHGETSMKNMFRYMDNVGFQSGEVDILSDLELMSSLTIPVNADVYIQNVSGGTTTLTVPYGRDLNVDGSIFLLDGGILCLQGAANVYQGDILVKNGGLLNVDGTMHCGTTVGVYEGGTLIANGNWHGYNPWNFGGTISGEAFALTQDKLETLLKEAENNGHYLVLRSSITLERDLTVNCNLQILGNDVVLTVPEGVTLTVGENGGVQTRMKGSIVMDGTWVNNGSTIIGDLGALVQLPDQPTYIVPGSINLDDFVVDDSQITGTMTGAGLIQNNKEFTVASSGKLVADGRWRGNDPHVMLGAQVSGKAFQRDQAFLEDLIAQGLPLEDQITLTRNLVLNSDLYIKEGGHLIVPKGVTLTVNGFLYLEPGGKLDVEAGGKLVNNSCITLNDRYTGQGYLHVAGTYTNGRNGVVQINAGMDAMADVTGIPEKYQMLLFSGDNTADGASEELLRHAVTFTKYGSVQVYTVNMLLQSDLTIPANMAVVIDPTVINDTYAESEKALMICQGVNVTVNGQLVINIRGSSADSAAPGRLLNSGTITLNKGGCLYTYGVYEGDGALINNGGTIQPMAKSVTIDGEAKLTRELGDPSELILTAVVAKDDSKYPVGQILQKVKWTTSNAKIATIDENGKVEILSAGTVKLTATAIDGSKKSDFVTLVVTPELTNALAITRDGAEETELLLDKADITGDYPIELVPVALNKWENRIPMTNKTVKWTSDNTKLAAIKANANGSVTVTIKKGQDGEATITATTTDASKMVAKYKITVMDRAPRLGSDKITLNPMQYTGAQVALLTSYGNEITNISINNDSLKADMETYDAANGILTILPNSGDALLKNGTINAVLSVECADGNTYPFNLRITVKSVIPSVTLKQTKKVDLFYADSEGEGEVTATVKDAVVTDMVLEGTQDFELEDGILRMTKTCVNTLRSDPKYKPDTKGTIWIYLEGYAHPIEKKGVSIATQTTKLNLATDPASSVINTAMTSDYRVFFHVLDKKTKENLILTREDVSYDGTYNVADDGEISIDFGAEAFKGTLTLTLYVQKENWTQPVKITHKVSVDTKVPTVKLGSTTLKLSNVFVNQTAETTVALNQGNMDITFFDNDNKFTTTAKVGTPAHTEGSKINVVYVGGKITASIQPGETVKAGTYTYTGVPYVLNAGEAVALKNAVKVKVKVSATAPRATLSPSTVKLNTYLTGNETAEVAVNMKDTTGYGVKVIGFNEFDNWTDYEDANVRMSYDSGKLYITSLTDTVGEYDYTLTPKATDNAGSDASLSSVKLTVQTYNSEKLAVAQSGKGKLDAINPDSEVVYTIGKITNAMGKVTKVELVGADSDKFVVGTYVDGEFVENALGEDAKGKQTFSLKMKDGVQYSTKPSYNVKFAYEVCGKKVLSPTDKDKKIKVNVSQSALKITAPRNLIYYMAQGDGVPMNFQVALTAPENAKLAQIAINEKTSPELISAMNREDVTLFAEEAGAESADLSIRIRKSGELKVGKTYKLILDVTPIGQTTDAKVTQVTISIKVAK